MNKQIQKTAAMRHVCPSTVRRWIQKGFFGDVPKDKNGAYILDEDLPLPYKTNGKIERDTSWAHSHKDI
ncbi:MAG: hypothetical protein IJU16_07430 [Clostridia bacterium]|nr:hypothetical protein [Clostridia bacterium]